MSAAKDLEQYKILLDKAQALVADYEKVLKIRTKERDDLRKQFGMGDNVVPLTPCIVQRAKRDAANKIIKIAMRRIHQTIGQNPRVHRILYELLDE